MSVKTHYEIGGAICTTALITSRHLQCAHAYIPPRHVPRASRRVASSSATASSATAGYSPDHKPLSIGHTRSRMCTKHTNLFACGHEISYLLAHSRFVVDPSTCPQLSDIMLYVDQGCGACDWEDEDLGGPKVNYGVFGSEHYE